MSISVLVNGANGKMGRVTVAAIEQAKPLTLAGTATRGDDLAHLIAKTQADVVVDFTVPNCVFENCQTIIESGARPIVGTTGLTLSQIDQLADACRAKSRGGLIAPNFSIGAILMMQFAKQAAAYFPNNEIIEYHHPYKLDAPSDKEKKTAEMMRESMSQDSHINTTTEAARGETYQDVPIHSVRIPGVFASQCVLFGGEGETLTIRHDATDRSSMMPGVVLACEKVMVLNELVYGLDRLL